MSSTIACSAARPAVLRTILSRNPRHQYFHSSRLRLQQNIHNEKPKTQANIPLPPSSSSTGAGQASKQPFMTRLRSRLKEQPVRWYPIPIGLGIAVLVGLNFVKRQRNADYVGDDNVRVQGPWQVHVMGALPLRTLSRIYGALNEYTLPHWFRVPGFKLYGLIFGVNFDEVENDLKTYTSLSDFFLRKLKPGSRKADDSLLISPADGTVVNFGYIENRRIESVKGATYSLDALLQGVGPAPIITSPASTPSDAKAQADKAVTPAQKQETISHVDEEEFADVNGISYSLDQLMGGEQSKQTTEPMTDDKKDKKSSSRAFWRWKWKYNTKNPERENGKHGEASASDASVEDEHSMADTAAVAFDVGPKSMPWTFRGVPKPGNRMFFAVVYLGPGDYHRFHSPASWVVERRRHFSGELFSVSPYVSKRLADLFVLNERVALLGRWRHGFFSMVPVGATNVGRIVINFDKDLRTNSGTRPTNPGRFTEANYASASRILHGQPLKAFDEMGGFMLGSTIVMVFEAPENFTFSCKKGQKIQVGTKMGDV